MPTRPFHLLLILCLLGHWLSPPAHGWLHAAVSEATVAQASAQPPCAAHAQELPPATAPDCCQNPADCDCGCVLATALNVTVAVIAPWLQHAGPQRHGQLAALSRAHSPPLRPPA